jgi:hypothetical protein
MQLVEVNGKKELILERAASGAASRSIKEIWPWNEGQAE